jgi:hypothetical protein
MIKNSCIFGILFLFTTSPAYAGGYKDFYADIAKIENVSTLQVKETLETVCAEIDDKPILFENCHRYAFVGSEIEQEKVIGALPTQKQLDIKVEQVAWKKQRDESCKASVNPDVEGTYLWNIYFNSCRERETKDRTRKIRNSK